MGNASELWRDGDRSVAFNTTLKAAGLATRAADDPLLFPERDLLTGLSRLRLALAAREGEWLTGEVAYELRARAVNETGGTAADGAILPAAIAAPYRVRQLDWRLGDHDSGRAVYRHEVDRALISGHPGWGEVTIGRQAIGLGRGMLFSALDLFAPFSPAEVDREWRRGVDAARIEVRLGDTSSAEAMMVFAESSDESAALARWRGYAGDIDAELLAGERAEDRIVGAAVSAAVRGSALHAEFALFDVPERQADGGVFGDDRLVAKAVAGASYTLGYGNGLTVLGEYHYSGFGVDEIRDASAVIHRVARGDAQILGRHAVGLQCSHPFTESLSGSLLILGSPGDGSGLVQPTIRWDGRQDLSFVVSAFTPWGADPADGNLRSEYGGAGHGLFLQLSLYY